MINFWFNAQLLVNFFVKCAIFGWNMNVQFLVNYAIFGWICNFGLNTQFLVKCVIFWLKCIRRFIHEMSIVGSNSKLMAHCVTGRLSSTTKYITFHCGHSITTWAQFSPFWLSLTSTWTFLTLNVDKNKQVFYNLPTSCCPRSFWMNPCCSMVAIVSYTCRGGL